MGYGEGWKLAQGTGRGDAPRVRSQGEKPRTVPAQKAGQQPRRRSGRIRPLVPQTPVEPKGLPGCARSRGRTEGKSNRPQSLVSSFCVTRREGN